jgi:hypothetical protein
VTAADPGRIDRAPLGVGMQNTSFVRGSVVLIPHVLRCGYTLAPGSWWWPSKVLLDGVDITNVPTDFGDAENSRLEVVFTQHPARFTGTVSDVKGQPVPASLVMLFSADRTLWAALVNDITSPQGGREGRVQRATASGSLPCTRGSPRRLLVSPTTTRL